MNFWDKPRTRTKYSILFANKANVNIATTPEMTYSVSGFFASEKNPVCKLATIFYHFSVEHIVIISLHGMHVPRCSHISHLMKKVAQGQWSLTRVHYYT